MLPAGNWALLQENTIYQYLMQRRDEKRLVLKPIYINNSFISNDKYYNVIELNDITNTKFPDIDIINIKEDKKGQRPAEVKFLTSQFSYHYEKKYKEKFEEFKKNNGCIIVYKHDILPKGLLNEHSLDIYELNQNDFISYVKENFDRLFFEQVQNSKDKKIWLFHAGRESNFWKPRKVKEESDVAIVEPGIKSGLWCPKKYIKPSELTTGDKVIFIKTSGVGQKELQNEFDITRKLWRLDRLCITTVSSPVMSREEFLIRNKKYSNKKYLWPTEAEGKKYEFIFQFNTDSTLENLNIDMDIFYEKNIIFYNNVKELFLRQREKSIDIDTYTKFLETMAKLNR